MQSTSVTLKARHVQNGCLIGQLPESADGGQNHGETMAKPLKTYVKIWQFKFINGADHLVRRIIIKQLRCISGICAGSGNQNEIENSSARAMHCQIMPIRFMGVQRTVQILAHFGNLSDMGLSPGNVDIT